MGIKDMARGLLGKQPRIVDIKLKFVYCGPDGAGKSTSLKSLYDHGSLERKEEITRLNCEDGLVESVTFFEAVSTTVTAREGFEFSFAIYEANGPESKKLILNGASGIISVADARTEALSANLAALQELEENLAHYSWTLDEIPWVIQYNKSDVVAEADICKLNDAINKWNVPSYMSMAGQHVGVLEPFDTLLTHLAENFDYETLWFPGISAV